MQNQEHDWFSSTLQESSWLTTYHKIRQWGNSTLQLQ